MFFKRILSDKMQAEHRALGPKNEQKKTFKGRNGILIKIFNEKGWPQQENVFWNLRNLEKVKSNLEKIEFHYVVSYFLPILKELFTKHYSQ